MVPIGPSRMAIRLRSSCSSSAAASFASIMLPQTFYTIGGVTLDIVPPVRSRLMTTNTQYVARKLCEQIQRKGKDRGLLIAFEGPDGSGKTTQRKLFKEWLSGEGYDVMTTKWNSSKLIKPIIRARKNMRSINQEEFCLLHAADFRHRLERDIMPALVQGRMVVADRFLFTALARDCARGLELDWLLHIYSAPV